MRRILNYAGLSVTKANDQDYQLTHYITTDRVDRYGDVVVPNGYLKYEEVYRKNAVIFFGHDSRSFPIGINLWLKPEAHGVVALSQIDKGSDKAKEVYRLNKEGILKSWSIGFIPKVETLKEDSEGIKRNFIEEWELLEYSSVPIPANPDAINLALKECKNEDIKGVLEKENEILIFKNDVNAILNSIKTELEQIKSQGTVLSREETDQLIQERIKAQDKVVAKKLQDIVDSLKYLNNKIKVQ